MSAIHELFNQAQLAEAAYADFAAFPNNPRGALEAEGFSTRQTTAFLQGWRFVSQFSDSGLLGLTDGSGFSAALFERLDASQNPIGQFTFAIAGSISVVDFAADFGSIAAGGVAFDQLLSMVNYVLRLKAGSDGTTPQVELLRGATVPSLTSSVVSGVGPGINPIELTLTGHSLGGFLGQVYQRIFGSAGVYTYNTLGLQRPDAPIFDQLTSLLGLPPGNFNSGPGENLLVPGEPAQLIGIIQGKPQIQIFSETQSTTTGPNVNTISAHRIPALTDSLAIYDLFAKIDSALNTTDPTIGIGKITDLLKASSNKPALSLEAALDSLRALFKDPASQSLTPTLTNNRNAFYTNLYNTDFQNRISAYFGLFSIVPLTGVEALTIEANAFGDIGYCYALKALNPFVVLGEEGVYAPHNQNSELDIYDPVSGNGTLTSQWVEDRAVFLERKLRLGAQLGGQVLQSNILSSRHAYG